MSTYARIANGVVAELYTVPAGLKIAECFHASLNWQPCDATVQVGWVASESGSTWTFAAPPPPPPPPAPTVAQQAAALLLAPVAVTSASAPALSGSYALDAGSQAHINAIVTNLLVTATAPGGSTFPGGVSTYGYPDASGTLHAFTVAQFIAFAQAIAAFVSGCSLIASGQAGSLPAVPLSIP